MILELQTQYLKLLDIMEQMKKDHGIEIIYDPHFQDLEKQALELLEKAKELNS